jgi:osmotically-inducible protein OsmY
LQSFLQLCRKRFERQEAERAAWAAPGVGKVDNQIIVSP